MVASIGRELRRARKARNLSLRALAAIAEVSPSLLSQIENSKVNPSVATLYSIATALSLPPGYFFDDHAADGSIGRLPSSGPASGLRIDDRRRGHDPQSFTAVIDTVPPRPLVHREMRARVELSGNVTWERLTPSDEAGVEFLEIIYEVGATSGEKLSRHSGREYGLVLEGTLVVELGFQTYTLSCGDSIVFDSSTPHRLVNIADHPARAVWVVVGA